LVSSDQSTFFHMFGESPTCFLANTKPLTCVLSFLLRSFLVHVFQAYGYTHLSAGDFLRLIDSCIRNGRIVPVEITTNLLRKSCLYPSNSSAHVLSQGWTHVINQMGSN
uniref:Uncharacterized protein n=1 Tax=Hucho hucho TaxID=62062 RepID=A0A4W5LN16_9TELE